MDLITKKEKKILGLKACHRPEDLTVNASCFCFVFVFLFVCSFLHFVVAVVFSSAEVSSFELHSHNLCPV